MAGCNVIGEFGDLLPGGQEAKSDSSKIFDLGRATRNFPRHGSEMAKTTLASAAFYKDKNKGTELFVRQQGVRTAYKG